MINILFEDNHVLCVEKPINLPVQEDASCDLDLLRICKSYLKEKYHKTGNVYLGLVHRLDRPVGGVMVFAKTSKAASRLSEAIRSHHFEKWYLAILDGTPTKKEATLIDYLYKNTKTNTVTVCKANQGKKAILSYKVLAQKKQHTLVKIILKTGRPHQIRVQFASRQLPLLHDQRYHPYASKGQIALWAYHLSFPHPITKEMITIECFPTNAPWQEFEVKV